MSSVITRQKKFAGTRHPVDLAKVGAMKMGVATQLLTYLRTLGVETCLRDEGDGVFHFTSTGERSPVAPGASRSESVLYKPMSVEDAEALMKKHGIHVQLHRTRTIYRINTANGAVQVNVDEVSYLGNYIEIRGESDEEIDEVAKMLGLDQEEVVDPSYFELLLAKNFTPCQLMLMKFYNQYEGMTYGIVSGVLTAYSLVLGSISEYSTAFAVITVLVALAFADAYSDAWGQFRSEWTKWESDKAAALRLGLCTLAGKIVMPLTFVVFFVLLPISHAVWACSLWMIVVLAGHAYVEAVARARSRLWHPVFVVILSFVGVGLTKLATSILDVLFAASQA